MPLLAPKGDIRSQCMSQMQIRTRMIRTRVEMGLHVDAAGATLVLANAPVLLEGTCAIDGRLVGARALSNLI
jgi:hypothetical protein